MATFGRTVIHRRFGLITKTPSTLYPCSFSATANATSCSGLDDVYQTPAYCKHRLHSFNKGAYHSIGYRYSAIQKVAKIITRFSSSNMASLQKLNFDNLVLRSLPIDPEKEDRTRQVRGACFSLVEPTPVTNPEVVAVSLPALDLLDLPESEVLKDDFAKYFSGSKILPGSETAAHCYCGHQFGQFAGQLGDGAAIYLGEIVNKQGQRWELQLKGAGLTPYSRTADGRKVLRSSIREFLCSEAMHHLGIPTTRAGSCITSDSTVIRDIYYAGNPIEEKCTVVSRIAPTFIRFGSFQICKPPDHNTGRDGPSVGRLDILDQLTDYVVKTFYPTIWDKYNNDKKTMCVEFFREVVHRTARLVAKWQCVGWCHGVLNTDNMSIMGLTIDYGPYGFLDRYDPGFICNDSDNGGRYTYEKQPEMCKWNCEKLAEALSLMMHMDMDCLYPVLESYTDEYDRVHTELMRRKFGLEKELPEDKELISTFLQTMEKTGADFTNCFRALSILPLPGSENHATSRTQLLEYLLSQCCPLEELIKAHRPRMDPRQLQMFVMLLQMNPDVIAQLGGGQKAIHDEIKRLEKVKELKETKPEVKTSKDRSLWSEWLDKYTARLGKEAEGLTDLVAANTHRKDSMNRSNPRFILRNYIAQNAIDAAEKGDYSEVRRVLHLLERPYSDDVDVADTLPAAASSHTGDETAATSSDSCDRTTYDSRPPAWSMDLRVT